MVQRQILKTEQKALEINLNDRIYGTFAEIGAGQEVARNFFQVGAAAGTIAKTMSAYDKEYSDAIYGSDKRYVCEGRVYKMLDHEYELIEERLKDSRPNTNFFVFADSISAINYQRTIKGNGWMGVRFQHQPGSKTNDVVIHVKMLDKNNRQQQEAIGILGVNLIYACFYYRDDLEMFIQSLLDGLKSRVSVDMIRTKGEAFDHFDNRLLSLYLVKCGLSEVAIFDHNKDSLHASEFLYRKELMIVRGHFRPPTKVTQDAFETSFEQFKKEENTDPEKCLLVAEITMENLKRFGPMDIKDFLDRSDMLCALGLTVIISDCSNHQKLINYLSDYKIKRLGILIGVHELREIIINKYENNQDGSLLTAFGELFSRNIKVYAYPALEKEGDKMIFVNNLPVPDGIKFLYQHLIDNDQIVQVTGYNEDYLHIIPGNVFRAISESEEGAWEDSLPAHLVEIIKEKGSFGYGVQQENFEYEKTQGDDAEYY
jgi:hypothetical protein